ncbi:hypothetical protein ACJJTC_004973 [Scirpophaga incertulas]
MNSATGKECSTLVSVVQLDPAARESNLTYLKRVGTNIEETLRALVEVITSYAHVNNAITDEDLATITQYTESVRRSADEAARWLRVSHAALRLRFEAPNFAREHAQLQTRRDTCFSQALASVTTGLLCWPPKPVLHRESLWGDMVVAVEDLQTVAFQLVKIAHSNSSIPKVSGTRGALVVDIPVCDSLYTKFKSKEHLTFTITAVFFNIGINNKASLAEALGETTPQYHSNSDNLDRISKYFHKYTKVFPADPLAATRDEDQSEAVKVPFTDLYQQMNADITALWHSYWTKISEEKGKWYAAIQITPPQRPWYHKINIADCRNFITTINRLRFGHCRTPSHLTRLRIKDEEHCDFCTEEVCDLEHIFMKCQKFNVHRLVFASELQDICEKKNNSDSDQEVPRELRVSKILCNPSYFKPVYNFVISTVGKI